MLPDLNFSKSQTNKQVKKSLTPRSKLLEAVNNQLFIPAAESSITKSTDTTTEPTDTPTSSVKKPAQSRFSFFSTLNSILPKEFLPKEFLGVQVTEIKKDLKDGGSQISNL